MITFVFFSFWLSLAAYSDSSQGRVSETPTDAVAGPESIDVELPDPVLSTENLLGSRVSIGEFESILNDTEERVGRDFKVPNYLRARVAFWLRVYTEFSSRHVVLYDRNHPEVVYSVMDFRPLRLKSRNEAAYEIVSKIRVKKELARVRQLLLLVNKKIRLKKKLTDEEAVISESLSMGQHKHPIATYLKGLRAQTGLRDSVIHGLFRADGYFKDIEKVFEKESVPTELMRVSLVESSFNPKALSRVGAAGVWQFMEGMGAHYMHVDLKNSLDERRSPIKASEGAAKYFRTSQRTLKNWFLTVISFNHGMTGIYKRMKKDGFSPERMLNACDSKFSLGFASGNFLAEFLAILYADKYRDIFYGKTSAAYTWKGEFFRIKKSLTVAELSRQTGVSQTELRELNLDIGKANKKIPAGYRVALPSNVFLPHTLLVSANDIQNTGTRKKKL